ncbi:hypothetical protein, partial [Mesorhizobium sp. M1C.F.Ca.ET.204.01.1.1]|uniref:hypothetical protein n=1 Tax=Mesorhizobium sp. M1C.F.Ca.ET.204.01.1.1 TaxID=2563929 RepID=UPI001AEE4571
MTTRKKRAPGNRAPLLIDEMLGLEVRDQALPRQFLQASPQWFSHKLKARSYRFERGERPFNPQNERWKRRRPPMLFFLSAAVQLPNG